MNSLKLNTPVVFFIYNRPEFTKEVFKAIKSVKPHKLLIIADGPKTDDNDDLIKIRNTRNIIDSIDWECEVIKNFSKTNMGCKNRISSGLDWVFSNVEEAIILEDDCVPNREFFSFCEELLEKFRYDSRIMAISGTNIFSENKKHTDSYIFSFFNEIWGWATWKRAWQYYDVKIESWPIFKNRGYLNYILNEKKEIKYWSDIFDKLYNAKIDTWDYQWLFSIWSQRGLNIIPSKNLVSNIGFGANSTHTSSTNKFANLSKFNLTFPLKHPKFIIRDKYFDKNYMRYFLPTLKDRLWIKIIKIKSNFLNSLFY